jgi:hypothetical protein
LRGVQTHLQGGLVSLAAEGSEEVADLLLAGVDDAAGGRLVDGLGDVLAEALEARTQQFLEGFRRQLRVGRGVAVSRRGGHHRGSGRQG